MLLLIEAVNWFYVQLDAIEMQEAIKAMKIVNVLESDTLFSAELQ